MAIAQNLKKIHDGIQTAIKNSGATQEVKLIAVCKRKPVSDILLAMDCNQKDFAENYVQEWLLKYETLKDKDIHWHYIGGLQRNKVKDVIGKAHLIHTLDSLKLAQAIDRLCMEKGIQQKCLIQVNVSEETQKSGILPADLFDFIKELKPLKAIEVKGLMMIGTHTQDETLKEKEFCKLRDLQTSINEQELYRQPLTELSMGMSDSYAAAIAAGATMIRIGTEIFGERT
jgi:PLP dependent protein